MEPSLVERFKSPDAYVSLILGLAVVFAIGIFVYRLFSSPTSLTLNQQTGGQTSPAPSAGQTHTVTARDTLWSIAEKYYQDGFKWSEIQKANQLASTNLEVGKQLSIPPINTTPTPTVGQILATSTETPASGTTIKNYTVIRGDTLWDIAIKQYNNGYRWVDIARANKLVNPDLIHAGNVLSLP